MANNLGDLDESLFAKHKYYKSLPFLYKIGKRWATQQWIFGGVDSDSFAIFFECAPSRDASALSIIIPISIIPGTKINKDGGGGYNNRESFGHAYNVIK
ncbi:hypothetical protein HZS_5240 [Henneguya salminicola]|nr:hypothetical protein HZS_5240 [Henneguya salminicola]